MISINYQTYGSRGLQLRLRFYLDGQTKFINVTKLLKGNLVKRHWNTKKKCFYSSAPNADENNRILEDFRKPYDERSKTWTGTLDGFMLSFDETANEEPEEKHTLRWVFQYFIDEMKRNGRNDDGTISGGYEPYEKTIKRMEEYCQDIRISLDSLTLEDMTPQFINKFLEWIVNRGNGKCLYVSVSLHALLNKSDKMGWFDIKDVERCNWFKKTGKSSKKYQTLTNAQCKKFVALKKEELPRGQNTELYRDFCTFILYTCQSTCDAVSLQYKDIQTINGVDHFVFKRRKIASKQSIDCSVPINPVMRDIMKRWKPYSKDGYIFPIRSKERIAASVINNGDIKHFISKINTWLKKVTDIIKCPFPLHTYVFRHTGITHYISKGIPVIYVANLAGTSVENCESIYYNNQGDTTSRDKVLSAIKF